MKTKTKLILLVTLTLSFAIANTVSASFFQGFELNNNGWNYLGGTYDATRVPSGTNGIASHTGSFHAEATGPVQLCDGTVSAATNWGGYSRVFPIAGFTTAIWVYLDMAATNVNDTRFDWIADSINNPNCDHRRDFAFNFGWYNDSDFTGSGPRFVVSGNTNTGRCNSFPKNPGMDPFAITTTGWYKLEGQFANNGGTLQVTLRVYNSANALLHTWVRSDPTDIIGTTIGGNRAGWFPSQEFPFLAFDDTSFTGIQIYCDGGNGPVRTQGYWKNHPDSWCEPTITIGGGLFTKAQAIAAMQQSTNRDMTYQMFAQLVAAQLNVDCLDSNQSCVSDAIQAADLWMADHHVGTGVKANSTAWQAIASVYNTLYNYNEGNLCAPHIE
jgi:hypothetical protein